MLWQAVSAMRFPVFGSYALIPSSNGSASLMPSPLNPLTVPAMLEDSVTPNPVPGEPDLVATTSTMIARTISKVSDRTRFVRHAGSTDLHATVDSVNVGQHLIVVWVRRLDPILVRVAPSTTVINANGQRDALSSLRPRDRVIVTGYTTTGTINSTTTELLRAFIVVHRVQAVVVDLGLRDSGTIAHWFRLALGPPSRAGAGGEIWLNASTKAVRQRPRIFHSRHPVAIASRSQHRVRTLSRA